MDEEIIENLDFLLSLDALENEKDWDLIEEGPEEDFEEWDDES